ncbi:hypothetical protein IOD16_12590 [Saccharothrix sp. 6-C]|uniref:Lipoprotein n=1 Tax=Saccharothrix texasensis TaxID=103734 RepID=A0A3N1H0M5_9PSEU|nr:MULTISPECIES: hypothetical protein [Saccharothrix]QQQ79189.1 hypothetical protein IOD16_12590 [Saccharothrix sp. 6-C]ROP36019.1 hypothetical protein EDD40_1280 [Saccharothrix texasensis]
MQVNRTLIASVGALALLLTACGDATTGTASPGATEATTETTTSTTSTTSKSKAPAPADDTPVSDVTAPGTELKVGDRAVVPFKYGTEKNGTIAITVTAIDQGANADLAAFGEKAKGITPFYIRVTVENVGGTDLSYSSLSLRALGADGKGTGVIISGDTKQCESETAKKDFTTVGAKYETCVLQGAREGAAVAAAGYANGDGYDKSPITWSK